MKKIILFLTLLLAIPQLSFGTGNVLAAEYPVRWTQEIKVKDLKEIDSLLDKPVDLSDVGGDQGFTMLRVGSYFKVLKLEISQPFLVKAVKRVEDLLDVIFRYLYKWFHWKNLFIRFHLVKTRTDEKNVTNCNCREYLGLKEKGFHAEDTYSIAMESWFKSTCYSLRYLEKAIPSRISYLKNFRLTNAPLKNLPLTLDLILSGDDEREAKAALEKGMTWKDFAPDAKVEVTNPNEIVIKREDSETNLTLLAWGDFNHDGVEDILLDVSHSVTSGTYRDYGHVILTRLEKDGKLVQIMKERN